ncbi:hypothetical protein PG984_012077 [Apiospora sp. TS-2023a]
MARFGYFQYTRLKIIVGLFCILVTRKAAQVARREVALIPHDMQRQGLQALARDPGRHLDADLYLPPDHNDSQGSLLPVLSKFKDY